VDYKKEVKKIMTWLDTYPMLVDVIEIPVVMFDDVDKSFMISKYRSKYVLKDDFVESGLWRFLSRNPQSIIACTMHEVLGYIESVDPDFSITYRNLIKSLVGSEFKSIKESYLDFKTVFTDTEALLDKAEEWDLEDNKRVLEIYFGVDLSDKEEIDDKPRHLGIVKEDD